MWVPMFFYKVICMIYNQIKRSLSYKSFLIMGFYPSLLKYAGLLKVSFMVGSINAFFSATNILVPVIAGAAGMMTLSMAVGIKILLTLMVGKMALASLLVNNVPGFFGAWALINRHWALRIVVPVLCIALFMLHPEGAHASLYALYWLIPVCLYFSRSSFAQALSSTFVAHAVGSVIWIYTTNMAASAWLLLIPLVALERLTFAVGIVTVQQALAYISQKFAATNTVKISSVNTLES